MKAKDIMSKEIASIKSDESIERAAQLMKEHNVGSIPVCCDNKVVGIVTDRDIALRSSASGSDTKQQKVSDVMSKNPVVGNPEMDVNDVARLMSDNQIRRMPIVDNNNLVGIVSLGDISTEPSQQNSAGEALKGISQPGSGQG